MTENVKLTELIEAKIAAGEADSGWVVAFLLMQLIKQMKDLDELMQVSCSHLHVIRDLLLEQVEQRRKWK
jgi:hypothetical protein